MKLQSTCTPHITQKEQIIAYLEEHQIPYESMEHPPVFTCEEAELYRPNRQGVSTKNLFLRDRHSHFYLLMTDCAKKTDLKALGAALNITKLHFASEEHLFRLLGVTPGAVTVLGLINDRELTVTLLIDSEIWESDSFLCHPLVNTSTLILSRESLLHFFDLSGHSISLVQIPSKEA